MRLSLVPDGFDLLWRDRLVASHRPAAPFAFAGRGQARMDMYRGNFDIEDYLEAREPLSHAELAVDGEGYRLVLSRHGGDAPGLVLRLSLAPGRATFSLLQAGAGLNRFWFRLAAEPGEPVWGCGEQMSHFDLRGRRFPLWTSEPGVGRDKTTEITWRSDVTGRAGGDYWTTNYPQPTFVSGRLLAAHLETSAYAAFDFRHARFHELEVWAAPERLELFGADALPELVSVLSTRFGRQPPLPAWVDEGVILGLKRGQDHALQTLDLARASGIAVAGLWCEDWAGVRETSFGTRLFWDWRWNGRRYPTLDRMIADLHGQGLRFLAYANPYLCDDGTLFPEADALGLFAREAAGGTARVDFGEFFCGVVDFTNPDACAWFAQEILRGNMLDLGIDGWMADFGEYLPIDVTLANGVAATLEHNRWPVRWAEVNARALAEAGRTGDALFFMRAGYTGVQRHCPLLWAGDQSVDFSRHDGLVTTIPAALSAGLLGNAYSHSDIGGYTSLFGNRRTPELFMRWAELAAFTPVMRTHEGNRPTENFQWWEDAAAIAHLARMVRLFRALAPYRRRLIGEAGATGLPLQRPLVLHYPDDAAVGAVFDQFLLGPDLLVAPVHRAGADRRSAYLPAGADWVNLWSGERWAGGRAVEVSAPLGRPPVFVRAGAAAEAELLALRDI